MSVPAPPSQEEINRLLDRLEKLDGIEPDKVRNVDRRGRQLLSVSGLRPALRLADFLAIALLVFGVSERAERRTEERIQQIEKRAEERYSQLQQRYSQLASKMDQFQKATQRKTSKPAASRRRTTPSRRDLRFVPPTPTPYDELQDVKISNLEAKTKLVFDAMEPQ